VDTNGHQWIYAIAGVLEAIPPAGSRGRAPVQGVWGQSPPEAESFLLHNWLTLPDTKVFGGGKYKIFGGGVFPL